MKLKINDIVRISGTRSSPYRKIEGFEGDIVVGRKLEISGGAQFWDFEDNVSPNILLEGVNRHRFSPDVVIAVYRKDRWTKRRGQRAP